VQVVVVEVDRTWGLGDEGMAGALETLAATAPSAVRLVAISLDPADPLPSVAPPRVTCLSAPRVGAGPEDPELLAAAAALGGGHARDLLVVAPAASELHGTAAAVGAPSVAVDDPLAIDVAALVRDADRERAPDVGVGPHPAPWPDDERLDPELLAHGDRRNVVDRYRYWSEAAIVAELAGRRHGFHVAVENWQHDLNIGTVVRNANAFAAAGVHIVGQRRWNRRGAMATDRYLPVHHHATVSEFAAWAAAQRLSIIGIDNVAGAGDLDVEPLPAEVVLVFGQEGPGLSPAMVEVCDQVLAIGQFGSTRSLNAGVASGIAMHVWITTHAVP
jgi:tRNA(Leu) C34 or U34 (ribose-2'-O)-methylase TrmL